MASNQNGENTQDESNENGVDYVEHSDFFEAEISRYSSNLEADPEDTYRRYGFTLYHSLPPVQMVLENRKLGFHRDDAIDTYNLAGIEIGKENYEGARELLEKALKEEPTLADAWYNLALCYEKLDRKTDAEKAWNNYLEHTEDEEEAIEQVRAHLGEAEA